MAAEKDGEETENGAAHAGQPRMAQPERDALPVVESPPLSPTDPEPELALEHRIEPKPEPEVVAAASGAEHATETSSEPETQGARRQAGLPVALARLNGLALSAWPRFRRSSSVRLKPRHRRRAVLTATAALAAMFGAVVGALFAGSALTPQADDASRSAVAQLTRQLAALEAELATSKAASEKAAATLAQAAAKKASGAEAGRPSPPPDVTGSIPPRAEPTPFPSPRPVEQITAAASRPPVLHGWTLRLARKGLFLVEGRGDIYQVVPGAPLPGVGPVQAIRRQDGRWVVVTPKGLIVSLRDRRHFE